MLSESMDKTDNDNSDSEGEFAFETDHLAVRGNQEYSELLKYIIKLEAQKAKALQDIESLVECQNKALDDPETFVKDLKDGKMNFPPRQTIPNIPQLDWGKYDIDPSNDESNINTKISKDDDDSTKVRGRKFTDNKPETFNQLWSCEEQRRLEELLEIYPEEEVEARRYKKIAEALGTRTPVQVMSRLQKYFAKLAKAGLPIPGRAPKRVHVDKKDVLYKKSTFFPHLHVPVKMEDPYEGSDAYDSVSLHETKNGNQYVLDLLKEAKEQRILDESSPVYHTNILCVGCQKAGFFGARWTDNAGTDFCTDCVVKFLPSENLLPIRYW